MRSYYAVNWTKCLVFKICYAFPSGDIELSKFILLEYNHFGKSVETILLVNLLLVLQQRGCFAAERYWATEYKRSRTASSVFNW